MGRAGLSYNDVAFAALSTIDMLGCHNQNSHFDELDAVNNMAKATDTI
jgi:hypothetical protein